MTVNDYIRLLAKNSKTANHELIEECIMYYGVCGTQELNEQQVKEFCRKKGLLK